MSESAFEYLTSHSLLFLATASLAGDVHVAPMFYANVDRAIFFSAPEGSATADNLKANPVAAIAIAEEVADWSQARGLQIEGPVDELEGESEEAAARVFQAKFRHLGDAALHTHYWRLDAVEVRYVHNAEAGNESFESLGRRWERDKVE